ncbi:hypothetical protein HAX54_044463, partial [Datura stramonium]|nr:hypothetical protein [Datura stramonium]
RKLPATRRLPPTHLGFLSIFGDPTDKLPLPMHESLGRCWFHTVYLGVKIPLAPHPVDHRCQHSNCMSGSPSVTRQSCPMNRQWNLGFECGVTSFCHEPAFYQRFVVQEQRFDSTAP